ncbi:MAG: hypothetical protein R3D02_15785 [Hyphomicrobiales bacterium]
MSVTSRPPPPPPEPEMAISRVAGTVGGIDDKIAFTLNGKVKRIAGRLQFALAGIAHRRHVAREDRRFAAPRSQTSRQRIVRHHHFDPLETGGIAVGEIVAITANCRCSVSCRDRATRMPFSMSAPSLPKRRRLGRLGAISLPIHNIVLKQLIMPEPAMSWRRRGQIVPGTFFPAPAPPQHCVNR